MPLSMTGWKPASKMPAYTCVSQAVFNELVHAPGMVEACGGMDITDKPVHVWPTKAADVFVRQGDVFGLTGQPWLLEADAAAHGTTVQPSTLPGAGLGVFATRPLDVGAEILPFFGQLVYHDLQVAARSSRDRLSTRVYAKGVVAEGLATTAAKWLDNALQLQASISMWTASADDPASSMVPSVLGTVMSGEAGPAEELCRPVWVVPASCCAGGKVNDPGRHQVANVRFEQRPRVIRTVKDLVKRSCGVLRVTRRIEVGEEVMVSYGPRHTVRQVA
ncbi:hypothetical protein I4F81_005112 [Pyropia yezoensis]|uniref:Uncharacterized protein n=1 Tax=Pyropia yezoensis TaxID=2788 RepID=A0ACC3BX98_PYRYE|nr:hypothetical protein I4F81_005112 [Neopyropia yezoensis]